MGSSPISVEVLKLLQTFSEIKLKAVWTSTPRPIGRGKKLQDNVIATYTKSLLWEEDIDLRCIERIDKQEIDYLRSLTLDFILVAAYGHILPLPWLNLPRLGSFNIHFSLLPRYRGASPIQAAILNGDSETGVTIQKMQEKLDTGDIVLSRSFPLTGLSAPQAFKASIEVLYSILPIFIQQLRKGKLTFTPQSDTVEGGKGYCRKIKKSDGKIQSSMSITEVYRKFLAYQPWPGIYFHKQDTSQGMGQGKNKTSLTTYLFRNLEKIDLPLHDIRTQYGEIYTLLKEIPQKLFLIKLNHPLRLLLVGRGNTSSTGPPQVQCLNLLAIQKSGKKVMTITDFLNGVKWSFPLIL